MVKLYVNLIKNKLRTIHEVPDRWKGAVQMELQKQGMDGEGNPIV